MVVACASYIIAGLIFLFIYVAFYRPLLSHPYPGDMRDVISAVSAIRLGELERWVSQEMTDFMESTLTPREQRIIRRRRRIMISERLAPIESNARLYLAFTRYQLRRLQMKPAGPRSQRDRLMQEAFDKGRSCCLVLMFAKATRTFMAWDNERLLKFHRETVLEEVREHMLLFLQLSATYGERHRDNLLNFLDAWELDEEAV